MTEAILTLLQNAHSAAYFGEPVTQLEHALQCAQCAREAGADDELILAALLHDIGHLLGPATPVGAMDHDTAGAAYLRQMGVSERVVELVAGHVQAKRYLTATNPAYYDRLSEASKQTLIEQGGPMSAEEVRRFESDPLRNEKLRLRSWDEQAKVPGLPVPALGDYRPLLERHAGR